MPAPVQNMSLSPTGDRMHIVSGNTLLEVMNYPAFDDGVSINYVHAIKFLNFPFYTIPAFTNDGKTLAYANDKGEITLEKTISCLKVAGSNMMHRLKRRGKK